MMSISGTMDGSKASSSQQRTAASEPSALRQICESAQALLAEGKVEEAFDFFVSALEAVLRKTRDLELLVAKLRRERVGKRSERIDYSCSVTLVALAGSCSSAACTSFFSPRPTQLCAGQSPIAFQHC